MHALAIHDWFWHTKTFEDMFGIAVPIVEKMVRPIIVYLFLVIVLRLFGKRELTNINPFDFVVLLTLSNTVQNAIIGDDNTVTGGVIGGFTLLAVNYLVVRFIFKHRRLDQLVQGKPTVLIQNGKMCEKNMAKELLTKADLVTVGAPAGVLASQRDRVVRAGAGRELFPEGEGAGDGGDAACGTGQAVGGDRQADRGD